MKIACIGNMNNNFFSLTRYLRDRGVDAELILLNTEHSHFLPESDSYDDAYKAYTRSVSWGDIRSFNIPSAQLRSDLQRYDFIFCNSGVPAFLHKCGRRADIFAPHGSDIFTLPFLRNVYPSRYWLRNFRYAWNQRQGIREARYLSLCPTDAQYEAQITRVRPKGNRIFRLLPMVYTPGYTPEILATRHGTTLFRDQFEAIRAKSDTMVFHHVRHMWTKAVNCALTKGNDVLVRGFARFAHARPDLRTSLIMFEYGQDYPATQDLVRELGIEDHVHWFPVLPRKEIMIGLSLCDVASGEFHDGWIAGGVGQEVMASGKPFLNHMDRENNLRFFQELPDIVNVRTPDQIHSALEDMTARPDVYRQIGENGRLWYQKYCIQKTIDEYMAAIEAT